MYTLSSTFLSSTLHPKNSMFHAQDMPIKQLQGITTPYCEIAKQPCFALPARQSSTPVQRPNPTRQLADMACIIQPLIFRRKPTLKCQDKQWVALSKAADMKAPCMYQIAGAHDKAF